MALLAAPLLTACGGQTNGSPAATPAPAGNVQPIQAGAGPANNTVDGLFTSVTICVPNTSNCQTIDGVQVDTGSVGLRLLATQVSLTLPRINDASGNQVANCAAFMDLSYAWGPMALADVRMAGETAASVPIQLMSVPGFPSAPNSCSQGGTPNDSLSSLGARGILGLGLFRQDCGPACSGAYVPVPPLYFTCPGGSCAVAAMPVANQLQNPVWLFSQDNNGLLIQLPSVPPTGTGTLAGSLIFGIGTQTNNALGSARVYLTNNGGDFTTTYGSGTYSGFLDTGSNGIFFLDDSTIGLPDCPTQDKGYSCPATTMNYTATNIGIDGTSAPVSFSIANAQTLFQTRNVVFNNLGGPDSGSFDWGMPFFLGRPVFIGIEGQSSPAGIGPFWAF